jgi:hypothetical protein
VCRGKRYAVRGPCRGTCSADRGPFPQPLHNLPQHFVAPDRIAICWRDIGLSRTVPEKSSFLARAMRLCNAMCPRRRLGRGAASLVAVGRIGGGMLSAPIDGHDDDQRD